MVRPDGGQRFHDLANRSSASSTSSTVDAFSVMPTSRQLKAALIIGYHRQRLRPSSVRLVRVDATSNGLRRCATSSPATGRPRRSARRDASCGPCTPRSGTSPTSARVLVRERIVWLPATDEIRVFLDGRRCRSTWDRSRTRSTRPCRIPPGAGSRGTAGPRRPRRQEPTSDVPAPAAQVAPTRRRRPRSPLSKRLRRLRKRISRPTSALPRRARTRSPVAPSRATRRRRDP